MVDPAPPLDTPDATERSEGERYDGKEYEVVRLGLQPITLAFACTLGVFAWFPFYFRFIGAGWQIAFGGAFVITLVGTLAAWRSRRPPHEPHFASLVALIANAGLLASIVVPALAFLLVLYWPRF